MTIKYVKLITSESILGDVEDNGKNYNIVNPLKYMKIITDNGEVTHLTRFFSNQKENAIAFDKSHVLCVVDIDDKLLYYYGQFIKYLENVGDKLSSDELDNSIQMINSYLMNTMAMHDSYQSTNSIH